jgi:hypothetical protein
LGIAIAPLKLEAASTATLNQVWQQANQAPLLFDVTEYGTLSVADYPEPKIRSDVYAIDADWNESPATLALAAESCIPLSWFAADLHREAIEQKLESISESVHELLGCSGATQNIMSNIRKSCGDSDCPEGVEAWLGNLEQAEFESVVQDIDLWLTAEPNWTYVKKICLSRLMERQKTILLVMTSDNQHGAFSNRLQLESIIHTPVILSHHPAIRCMSLAVRYKLPYERRTHAEHDIRIKITVALAENMRH